MHWVSWLGDDADLMTLPVCDCENAGTCGLQTQLSDGLMIPSSEEAIRDSTISGAFWHSADRQVRNWLRADRWASHLCQDKLRPGARTRKTSRIGWWQSLIIIGQGALEEMPLIFDIVGNYSWLNPSFGENLTVFLKLSCIFAAQLLVNKILHIFLSLAAVETNGSIVEKCPLWFHPLIETNTNSIF